eukprot:3479926-Lingulodinium_polyedra.AAC.1
MGAGRRTTTYTLNVAGVAAGRSAVGLAHSGPVLENGVSFRRAAAAPLAAAPSRPRHQAGRAQRCQHSVGGCNWLRDAGRVQRSQHVVGDCDWFRPAGEAQRCQPMVG